MSRVVADPELRGLIEERDGRIVLHETAGLRAGLALVLGPESVKSRLHTSCDVVPYGTLGSIWLAMGVVAIRGLRDPLKFVPLLLVQLIYKMVWFASIFVPLWMTGRFPATHAITTVLFGLVVGDLIAIPFRYAFAKPSPT